MATNLILSGGVAHEYGATSQLLRDLLLEVGVESDVLEDFTSVEDGVLQSYDMLTLNCVRWTCDQTPNWQEEWGSVLSSRAREELLSFFGKGSGMLALHCATICFDDWPEYRRILGAWWEWGHSSHAPCQRHSMHVLTQAHPITRGLADFEIEDELYTYPRVFDTLQPLIDASWEDSRHPILWTREYGPARICYNAMGHGVEAFMQPDNRLLLQRAGLWVLHEL